VVNGQLQVFVEKANGNHVLLEVLNQGSVIGSYSVLNSSPYKYTIKAKGNV
jgi:CRP-like cAMP-binding protein